MEFLELSSNLAPKTKTAYRDSKFPVACTLTPCLECELPKVQYPVNEIIRCVFCKGYLNLYCIITPKDYIWRCNLCSYLNKLPASYVKLMNKPRTELQELNFEIYADESFIARPPMPLTLLFLIDISLDSFKSGFLETICRSIEYTLQSYELNDRALIGFVLFDTNIHFVNISNTPGIITVNEKDDNIWLPLPIDCLLVNIRENLENVLACIKAVSTAYEDSYAYRTGLLACKMLLKGRGGKVFAFLYNNYSEAGHPKELALTPTTDFYRKLAQEFVDEVISCDLFISALSYCGVAVLGELSKYTGGEIHYYDDIYDKDILYQDIYRRITAKRGLETGIKLRTSQDWRISNIYGHYISQNEILTIPEVTTLSYTYEFVPKYEIASSTWMCFQASILYTSEDGIRLIRIINKKIPLTENLKNLLESINCDNLILFYIKQAASVIIEKNLLVYGLKYLQYRCSELVRTALAAIGELPGNLNTFIVKVLGLMKHPLFASQTLPCKSN
jgi:protein transport protein SEC24